MIKFFKLLPYHFKGAFKSIKRNLAMSISSATAVTITLILIELFMVVAGNINVMSESVETSVQIFVRIDPSVPEEEYDALQKQIEGIANVDKVRFSSKEEQFDIIIESPDGGESYEIMRDVNPLPSAYYVDATEGKYVEQVTEDINKIEGILSAEFGEESVATMLDAFQSIRYGGMVFVVALCVLAIFLISNTIKITIQARSEEIAIMRNVGADNVFIKTPFMLEGMMIGLMGAIIPVLLMIFGYGYAYDSMGGIMFSSLFPMVAPMPFVYWISLALIGISVVVGMIGSFLSVNKYLKWKR